MMPSIVLSPALLSTEWPSTEEQATAVLEVWEAKMAVMAASHFSDSILATAAAFDPDEDEAKELVVMPLISKDHFIVPFEDVLEPTSMSAILSPVYS